MRILIRRGEMWEFFVHIALIYGICGALFPVDM